MNRLLRKWLHYREMEKMKAKVKTNGNLIFPIPTEEEQKAFDQFLGIEDRP